MTSPWNTPSDPEALQNILHWNQAVQLLSLGELNALTSKKDGKNIAFLGYATDEGVKRNNGRPGAAAGPDALRVQMAKLAYHLKNTTLTDFGNISCPDGLLEETQEQTASAVTRLLQRNFFPILLGGGHDMAWAHFKGIADFLWTHQPEKKLGIINFDAHLDLRKPLPLANSGTPFYQAGRHCQAANKGFNYFCLGLQSAANSQVLLNRAEEFQVAFHTAESCWSSPDKTTAALKQFIDQTDCLYLTIDLDVFSSAFAPGVSAASPMGIDPFTALTFLKIIKTSGKVISMDIAELNPHFDRDQQTARLGARLIYHWLT